MALLISAQRERYFGPLAILTTLFRYFEFGNGVIAGPGFFLPNNPHVFGSVGGKVCGSLELDH